MRSTSRGRGFLHERLCAHPYDPWLRNKIFCVEDSIRSSAGPVSQIIQSTALPIYFPSTPLTRPLISYIQRYRGRCYIRNRHDLNDQHLDRELGLNSQLKTLASSITEINCDNTVPTVVLPALPPCTLQSLPSITKSSLLDRCHPPEIPATVQVSFEQEHYGTTTQQACSERERFFQDLDSERRRVDAIMRSHDEDKNRGKWAFNKARFRARHRRRSSHNDRDCCEHLRRALFFEERRRIAVEKQLEAQRLARITAEARAGQEAYLRVTIEERLESQRLQKENAEKARIIAEAQVEEEVWSRRIVELEARLYADMQARLRAERDEIANLELEARIQVVLEIQKRKEVESLLRQRK